MITVKQGNKTQTFKSLVQVCEAYGLDYNRTKDKRSRDGLPDRLIVKSDLEIIFKAEESNEARR